jgi:hypothetical protein
MSGNGPTRPASSPSSWSSARRATRRWTARSTPRACSISSEEIAAALAARLPGRPGGHRQGRAAEGDGHRLRRPPSSLRSGTPSWPRRWRRRGRPPPRGGAWSASPRSAAGCRPTPRATSGRPCRCTGSHLGTITELNGWDAMNPGHLDQHLQPFYEQGLRDGTLDREQAKELLACFWIKVNNHPAPPKVGVTAKESGTYNDFTNINLGGLRRDGATASASCRSSCSRWSRSCTCSSPAPSVHISARPRTAFCGRPAEVIRKGLRLPLRVQRRPRRGRRCCARASARGRPRGRLQRLHRDRLPSARRPTC